MTSYSQESNRVYVRLLFASVLLALIPVLWNSLDLQVARFFFFQATDSPGAAPSNWWWVRALNLYTPGIFRGLVLVAFIIWLTTYLNSRWKHWRLPLAFVVLAGIAGPGLAVNVAVKPLWERARPVQIVEFGGTQQFSPVGEFSEECSKDCSFVSGHTSCGFFICSLCLIAPKRRAIWIFMGVVAGAAIGFARICAMDHWLSDVLWAFPVTLLSSWLVWQTLLWFQSHRSGRSTHPNSK